MAGDLVRIGGFEAFVGRINPTRTDLQKNRKNLKGVLTELRSHTSVFGVVRSYFGSLQKSRLLNTVNKLPNVAGDIADNLSDKAEEFLNLRNDQLEYLDSLNKNIQRLLDDVGENTSLPEGDYQTILDRINRGKSGEAKCELYASLVEHFVSWSEDKVRKSTHSQGLEEYKRFREETLFNLLGINYAYENLRVISDAVQRRVVHLRHVLAMHGGVIRLEQDVASSRRGLIEVAGVGERVYAVAGESYSCLEKVIGELRDPGSILVK